MQGTHRSGVKASNAEQNSAATVTRAGTKKVGYVRPGTPLLRCRRGWIGLFFQPIVDVLGHHPGLNERPNAAPGVSQYLPGSQKSTSQWFNTAAFLTPAQFTFGNLGRNTLIGPGFVNLDLVMVKSFESSVLMLSATPVNNRLADLKNQIAFITEGDDEVLASDGIQSIEATIRL